MDIANKRKWQVRLAAVLIFVLGFAAGALTLNAYKRWRGARAEVSRQDRFTRMLDSLNLNADQKTQVQQILGDARQQLQGLRKESEPKVVAIRQQADEKLQKVLTPQQWTQFQQERDKMHGRDRRGREDASSSP
jgi:Spy/CpxP family protein refolding chaperone